MFAYLKLFFLISFLGCVVSCGQSGDSGGEQGKAPVSGSGTTGQTAAIAMASVTRNELINTANGWTTLSTSQRSIDYWKQQVGVEYEHIREVFYFYADGTGVVSFEGHKIGDPLDVYDYLSVDSFDKFELASGILKMYYPGGVEGVLSNIQPIRNQFATLTGFEGVSSYDGQTYRYHY